MRTPDNSDVTLPTSWQTRPPLPCMNCVVDPSWLRENQNLPLKPDQPPLFKKSLTLVSWLRNMGVLVYQTLVPSSVRGQGYLPHMTESLYKCFTIRLDRHGRPFLPYLVTHQ